MRNAKPGRLVRDARVRAGLTQRELARRAGTAQSVVARIESDASSPAWSTIQRLLKAAAFELRAELVPAPVKRSHMLDDVRRILQLSPEQRLLELHNASRMLQTARKVVP